MRIDLLASLAALSALLAVFLAVRFFRSKPSRTANLAFFLHLSLWPAFCLYLYENQSRGVYPPERDTILIPMVESLVLWGISLAPFLGFLMLHGKEPGPAGRWGKYGLSLLLQLGWVAFAVVGLFEVWGAWRGSHYLNLAHGLAYAAVGFWGYHRVFRRLFRKKAA